MTETFDAIEMAKKAGYTAVISHRSGETEDAQSLTSLLQQTLVKSKLVHLHRTDRIAKYNQLLRIEDQLRRIGCIRRHEIFLQPKKQIILID